METKNTITVYGNVAFIFLTQGYVVIIDTKDVDLVKNIRWCSIVRSKGKTVYASGWDKIKKRCVYMHRYILNLHDPTVHVDHKNQCGLDCRRSNIRVATYSENAQNRSLRRNNKSGYIGVFKTPSGRYESSIKYDNKHIHIGTYFTAEEAAIARDKKLMELHGSEFLYLNDTNNTLKQEPVKVSRESNSEVIWSSNKLGIKGVCVHKGSNSYRAYITENNKSKTIGYFKTKFLAQQAREKFLLACKKDRDVVHLENER